MGPPEPRGRLLYFRPIPHPDSSVTTRELAPLGQPADRGKVVTRVVGMRPSYGRQLTRRRRQPSMFNGGQPWPPHLKTTSRCQ